MGNELKLRLLSQKDLFDAGCFDLKMCVEVTENAMKKYCDGLIKYPEKVSQIFDEATQDRINCLPATLMDEKICGMKWVSVFPGNPVKFGCNNVSAVILLSEIEKGFPIAFMEGTMCSNLRTASVSAVAAKYLAPSNVEKIGFIGSGEQAKTHFMAMKSVFPSIKECRVSSNSIDSQESFKSDLERFYSDVNIVMCGADYESAVLDADIIITANSGQEPILKANWIRKGCLYCHVGGWEDEFAVALKADKIVCDHWESAKHRTQTISRMFKQNLLSDNDIYSDLDKIVSGERTGRTSDDEFIYFNAVGLSYVDVALSYHMYTMAVNKGTGTDWTFQNEKFLGYPNSFYRL